MSEILSTGPAPEHTAAGQGRRLQMWRPRTTGPNSASAGATSTIQARARDAQRNNPWFGTAIEKSVSNGIGTGIQAKPMWGSAAFKAAMKRLWNRWMKVADADGVVEFYGLQALAWREWREAGEVFIRLRSRRASDGLPVPLQIQLIESEQCPQHLYTVASNGNAIRAGVEFSAIGKRVAYWFYRGHPGDAHLAAGEVNWGELVRVPADQVRHLFRQLRAGQIRGIPDAAPVLVRMFNLDKLNDNVLERQSIANLFAGWYTTKPANDGADDGLAPPAILSDVPAGIDRDGTPLAGLEPGTMQELPPGVEPKFSSPPSAGSDYAEFVRSSLMAIAARLGVPYELLTGDLRDISDRALRLVLNEFRRVIEMDQWLYMIPQFCQAIREAWFDAGVLAGAIEVAGYAETRDDVVETQWVPQGWPWSHPVQDVVAERNAVRAGFKSRSDVVLGSGEDPELVDEAIVADNARADSNGLVFDSDPRKTSAAGLTQARPEGTQIPSTEIGDD